MILIDFLCLICLLLLTFDPIKNQEKKINRKIKSKIQEDIHEENLEHCPS
jgi:hypothetical protein